MLYKIVLQRYIFTISILFFFRIGKGQETTISKYGLAIINMTTEYQKSVLEDSAKQLVELKQAVPGLVYDLRYATRNNFMHRSMYPKNTRRTYLRILPAKALGKVQQALNKKGLGLKIYDAYRPYSVTIDFWEPIKDERYVANPARGSGHNRGLAVDLTIIDLKTGMELDMGTGYDNFSDSAHHSYTQLPAIVLTNRSLLKEIMEQNGFVLFETEWWHYSWPNNRNYEVLDIPFSKLKRDK